MHIYVGRSNNGLCLTSETKQGLLLIIYNGKYEGLKT